MPLSTLTCVQLPFAGSQIPVEHGPSSALQSLVVPEHVPPEQVAAVVQPLPPQPPPTTVSSQFPVAGLQLGAEWQAPGTQVLGRFAWYGAIDLQLWQERDFEPDFVLQGGLAATGKERTWRFGVEYSHGRPPLGEFFQDTESRVTLGMWVDF